MSFIFPQTEAEVNGFISLHHQLNGAVPRYFLLVPHDSCQMIFPKEVEKYFPADTELLHKVLLIRQDKGSRLLAEHIIKYVPGGAMLCINVARGIMDLNRTREHALGRFIDPLIPESAKHLFFDMYDTIDSSISAILAALPPECSILCLHTMQTNPINDVDGGFKREQIEHYIKLREADVGNGPHTNIDIITGPSGEEHLADLRLKALFIETFIKHSIAYAENDPYATERNIHKTTDYMLARPGRVLAVDVPKDFLCTGTAFDKSFSYVNSEPDATKVNHMGNIFVEVLKKVF